MDFVLEITSPELGVNQVLVLQVAVRPTDTQFLALECKMPRKD